MDEIAYLDFDLLVEGSAPRYRSRVLRSPAGDASGVCLVDLAAADLQACLRRFESGDTDEPLLIDLGGQLFKGLFANDVAITFRASLGQVRGQGKGLRVRLRLEPPELAALPWEVMYDPQEDRFPALSAETPLVRYLPIPHPPRPIAVSPPLCILVAIANPTDVIPLDVEQEKDIVQRALHRWLSQKLIRLHVLEHATVARIIQAMRSFRPHVFHFIGHGHYKGDQAYVILEDEEGRARSVDERSFREFFLGIHDTRLAVLNACQRATTSSAQPLTSLAPRILQRDLSAVVAMQAPISDEAALIFSREFYRSLALGYPVDAAMAEARRGIYLEVGSGVRDWGTPVLYMRTPDGRIFDVERESLEKEPASAKTQATLHGEQATISRTLGKYRILGRLGRGGMGQVYKAYQPGLKRYVAVKILHGHLADREDFVGRFEREAAAVARLRHPNIVQVHDFDSAGDLYYMVMEFVEGPTLEAELGERKARGQVFALAESARILSALANALDYAHSQGMVHRDLKPANIMFTAERQVVLADFGIARILGATRYTATGAIAGTPVYMSPEQGKGERCDARSDIYSLGVLLFKMVTGRVPFEAETPFGIIMKHINEPAPRPRTVNPDVPEAVERVILKAMSKSPDDRYQMAGDMARALGEAVGVTGEQTPDLGFAGVELLTIPLEPVPVPLRAPKELPVSVVTPPPSWPGAPFQVPADLPHFVGREKELAEFCEVLAHTEGGGTYCLTGMGGIGKTALATHAAHTLRDFFADGVLWANAATSEPLAILDSWASAFGCDFSGQPDLNSRAAALRGVLADKKVLLILDDVQSADQVRPLLPSGPQNTVLLTTRNLELGVALNAYEYPLSALTPLESRQLLTRIVGDKRVVGQENLADEICELLGHLPLAVSIAAQRLASRRRWGLADLAERLGDEKRRLDELKISDREVRASFAVSWEALDEDLRQSFATLAVFEGRAFRASGLAAIGGTDRRTAEDRLHALVSLSLVLEEGKTRYRQHPLLADFARECLAELGLSENTYARMVHYYRWYAAQNQHNYPALEREWENLSAGMKAAYEREMWPVVLTYGQMLADAWFARGYYADARQGYRWASEAAQVLGDTQAQAHALLQWGRACIEQKDRDEAKKHLFQSLRIFKESAHQEGIASSQHFLARIALEQTSFDEALRLLTSNRRIREQLDDPVGIAATLNMEARVSYLQGNYEKAEQLGKQALVIQEAANDANGSMVTLHLLASNAIVQNALNTAETYGLRALALSEKLQDKSEQAMVLNVLSDVHRRQERFESAQVCAEKSLALLHSMGDLAAQALVLYQLSRLDKGRGQYASALEVGLQSLTLCQDLHEPLLLAYVLIHIGDLQEELGQPDQARDKWHRALNIGEKLQHPTVIKESQNRLDR